MDKLSEIIKIPIYRPETSVKEYLDLLASTLRTMLELITQNTNTLHQLIIIGGGAGVVDHGGLTGLTDKDHPGSAIINTPAGGVAATDVQAAINELDTDKAAASHNHAAGDVTSGTFATARIPAITEAMQSLSDNTTCDVSTSKHGYVPKAPNLTTQFLRGDGAWAIPASNFLIPEVAHTTDATLGEADVGKMHTDRGAAAGDITLTLPSSPTAGWWYGIAHVGNVASGDLIVLGYAADNRKINYNDGSGNLVYKLYMDRDTYSGAASKFVSLIIVALGDGSWAVVAETGNSAYYWYML